jgi:hypothetical protein
MLIDITVVYMLLYYFGIDILAYRVGDVAGGGFGGCKEVG